MRILYIEPFEGGSHAAFTQTLTSAGWADWTTLTLPARHWKWRMRGAASYFALERRDVLERDWDLVFASAYLPLAELHGLVPKLAAVPSVLYFHENQLSYPTQPGQEDPRDLHFGFTQMVSGLAATRCVFNSAHNRDSFLLEAKRLLERMPDAVPRGWDEQIRAKSQVLGVPLDLPNVEPAPDPPESARADGPLIVWNHRWEFDKGPEAFFDAMAQLHQRGLAFRLAVCGQAFRDVPTAFAKAERALADRIEHWGYFDSRADYLALLGRAQLVVSTAQHEFFGISMLEAAWCGARPVVPKRLSYPELFPSELLYEDDAELIEGLAAACEGWTAGTLDLRSDRRGIAAAFQATQLLPRFRDLCETVAAST
jgi:glycosyltransferase involved in cell wall biosynthesis